MTLQPKQINKAQTKMPETNIILFKLICFNYDTSLDLYKGHYHIKITDLADNLCMIIIPREKFRYKFLPLGFSNQLETFSIR